MDSFSFIRNIILCHGDNPNQLSSTNQELRNTLEIYVYSRHLQLAMHTLERFVFSWKENKFYKPKLNNFPKLQQNPSILLPLNCTKVHNVYTKQYKRSCILLPINFTVQTLCTIQQQWHDFNFFARKFQSINVFSIFIKSKPF